MPLAAKPEWLRVRLSSDPRYFQVREIVRSQKLHTVCEEARCPNIHECWGTRGTATFMILGNVCTRRCRFCSVRTGLPGSVDRDEPRRVAESVERMGLRHVVVTMVARDDLRDGGAGAMARTVGAIRAAVPACRIEVLPSDLAGPDPAGPDPAGPDPAGPDPGVRRSSVETLVDSGPDIIAHNLETVRRLTPAVRSHSDYDRSLGFLRTVKELAPPAVTKSSLMLGLGEEEGEVVEAMADLRAAGVDILNLGQYLQPGRTQLRVKRFWRPDEFDRLRRIALDRGFRSCDAGPFVRSSYHAEEQALAAPV